MASFVYNIAKKGFLDGSVDFDTHTVKILLVQSGGTPNKDHATVAAVLGASTEVSVSGYARQTLASRTVTVDNTGDKAVIDAADVTFTSLAAGETVDGAVIYREVTNDSDSIPIVFVDFTNTATDGNNFVVQFHASGIAEIA